MLLVQLRGKDESSDSLSVSAECVFECVCVCMCMCMCVSVCVCMCVGGRPGGGGLHESVKNFSFPD